MLKRYRIRSKVRFILFMALMVLIIGIIASSLLGLNDAVGLNAAGRTDAGAALAAAEAGPVYRIVIVKSGDTLWDIAACYADESMDLRKAVWEIEQLNGMESAAVTAGQELRIPLCLR